MTVELELSDEEAEWLLIVLQNNANAVEPGHAARWTRAAASRIDRIRESVEEQME